MQNPPTKNATRLGLGMATVNIILGAFGIRSLGLTSDWIAFYAAANFFRLRQLSDLYQIEKLQAWQALFIGDHVVSFFYPPVYTAAVAPLAWFSPWPARWLWLGVNLVAIMGTAWLAQPWSRLRFSFNLLFLLAFPPLAYSLAVGQNTPITLLLFSTIVALEWRGQTGYVPGFLAGLIVYKPQLLIPLGVYWLIRRRWRSLFGMVAMGCAVFALSWLLAPDAMIAYLQMTGEWLKLASISSASGANLSFYAQSPIVGLAVSLAVLLTIAWLGWKRGSSRYTLAALWLAPLLVTPYVVIYEVLLAALPLSLLLILMPGDWLLQLAAAAVCLTPLLGIILLSTYPVSWALLCLFALCAWRAYHADLSPGEGGDISEASPRTSQV